MEINVMQLSFFWQTAGLIASIAGTLISVFVLIRTSSIKRAVRELKNRYTLIENWGKISHDIDEDLRNLINLYSDAQRGKIQRERIRETLCSIRMKFAELSKKMPEYRHRMNILLGKIQDYEKKPIVDGYKYLLSFKRIWTVSISQLFELYAECNQLYNEINNNLKK
jgi:hypothetical protein